MAAVQLSLVPGVGPRVRQVLLDAFGSPAAILRAVPDQLRKAPGVGPKLVQSIMASRADDAEAEIELCRQNQIAIIAQSDPNYPRPLLEIPDPPGLLYTVGRMLPQDSVAIAIVGSRHATQYGKMQAQRLASGLARAGVTIVSGLARGIDAAAHRGALEAGGRTLAVMASGVLDIYPPEHKELACDIAECGAVLTENPPRTKPRNLAFPQRNRIITGLSLGVVVVEAALRSGAMISARHAMEQNREVFAVPGRIDSRVSHGCHQLLRDGAKLVESTDDILEELGPLAQPAQGAEGEVLRHPAELNLNQQERAVLAAIDVDPTGIDQVVHESGIPVHRVLSTISVLETRRLVRRVSGQSVVRA